jgi:hypothetical protein
MIVATTRSAVIMAARKIVYLLKPNLGRATIPKNLQASAQSHGKIQGFVTEWGIAAGVIKTVMATSDAASMAARKTVSNQVSETHRRITICPYNHIE